MERRHTVSVGHVMRLPLSRSQPRSSQGWICDEGSNEEGSEGMRRSPVRRSHVGRGHGVEVSSGRVAAN